ncbi:DEAD/DEAH box helicase [Owenweeksia hongkongensis]|uniref:DEAD/DEAH box helicase n=1 Tax=Owenweeksia hongkongensis TaxID=253245 RepID=UPI003A92BB89
MKIKKLMLEMKRSIVRVEKTNGIFAPNFKIIDLKNFEALGLSSPVLKALSEMGFENPTEIQSQAIPLLLSKPQDFIGLAQTGTGKTAAFGLPLIDLIEVEEKRTQALILAPTRELAQQIGKQLADFSKHLGRLNIVCVFGGASISGQMSEVRRGAQIIVATPGRLIDLTKRGAVKLSSLEYIILDEADEMLNMGFKDDLDYILAQAPAEKITWLFSATMPAEIKRIVKNYMVNPAEVKVNQGNIVNTNIEHQYAVLKASDKTEALRRLLDFDPAMYGVVFTRTKRDAQKVAEDLVESGYAAEPLHGDLSQAQRDAVMRRFRAGTLQMLIATDVAARGIDVDNLTHVVHFALPDDPEYYTHRSGRTARAGKKGVSLSLITKGDMRRVKYLESKLGIKFEKALIPEIAEIAKNRVSHWADKLASQEISKMLEFEMMQTAEMALQAFTREEIIAKFISGQLDRVTKKNSISDLNDTSRSSSRDDRGGRDDRGRGRRDRGERGERGGRDRDGREAGMHRFFINLGTMDNLNKGGLLRFICDNTGLTSRDVGRISLDQRHTLFDVSEDASAKIASLNEKQYDGRDIRVNRDDDKGRKRPSGGKRGGGKGKPQRGGNRKGRF